MAAARRAAVLGSPIRHSLSPALHQAAYAAMGLPWTYGAYEVDEQALPGFLRGLDEGWAGLSITMPLKRPIIPLLDEVSELAATVESVNTVLIGERRRGENTDVPGMVAALRERGVSRVGSGAILGGGATASSAFAALGEVCEGEITVYVRGEERAGQIRALAERLGRPVGTGRWDAIAEAVRADLVVATTPAGGVDGLRFSLPRRGLGVYFDVVYDPWPTRLAAAWAARGGAVVGGLDLLVHQAVLQVEMMTGQRPAPLAAMREAGERALAAARR